MNRFFSLLLHIATCALVAILPLALISTHASAQRAPYLQRGTPSSMTVAWTTSASSASVVCYGASPTTLTNTATGAAGTAHIVRIDGLTPATRYHYAAGSGSCPPASAGSAADFFVTAPMTGARTPFRVWLVGDSGTGGTGQRAVRDAMLAYTATRRPDIFIHVGDMAYDRGTTAEFTSRFFAPYAEILRNTVAWPALGNHEGYTSNSATQTGPYYDAYVLPTAAEAGGIASGTEAYYAFDYGNAHFIVLDSYETSRSTTGAMARWLESDLAATTQDWIVAFFHHGPYTKGTHDSDTEIEHIQMRENLLPILEAGGVDVVLAGHSHIYERTYLAHGAYDTPTTAAGHIVDMRDGRPTGDGPYVADGAGHVFVTAGHGGASVGRDAIHPLMYFTEPQLGSCLIDVDGPTLTLSNLRSTGAITDTVQLVKPSGLRLITPSAGRTYRAGAALDITWSRAGSTAANVSLAYSIDGGPFVTIVASTPNDGRFTWTTPMVSSTRVRVSITSTSDAADTDTTGDFTLSNAVEETLIPAGGIWEYEDTGADLGTTWRTSTGGWPTGPAQLGYGDGDEATVVRDANPNIPTVYFRKTITVGGTVTAARYRVTFDDGVALWVNGTQVATHNVSSTAFSAWATSTSADNEVAMGTIPASAFVRGTNVIAAVAKQVSATSSDLSFDLELIATVEAATMPMLDGGVPAPDAGTDAGTDAGFDAGTDAGTDAGFDAGVDAGTDAGFDAGLDAGTDAGFDSGAAMDAGTGDDAGALDDAGAVDDAGASADAGRDAATSTDAGRDAGRDTDGGTVPGADAGRPAAPTIEGGCGCRVGGAPSRNPTHPLALLSGLALLVLARARRRAR